MRTFAVLQARTPSGEPAPVEMTINHCVRMVFEAQALTTVQQSIALTTEAQNLGAAEARESLAGWELISTSAWFVGDAEGQARPIAANEPWSPPSSVLAGVWAKSASGSITLVCTGGVAS